MKFTKTTGQGAGPTGAKEPCVTYHLMDGTTVIAERTQWPSIQEGSPQEVAMRPHFWGDRNWQFALTYKVGATTKLYGFAKNQEHVDRLLAKAVTDKLAVAVTELD